MEIRRVERFEVDGQKFETLAKAQDHCDGMVNVILQRELMKSPNNSMFTVSDVMKITEVILENRAQILAYLSVNFDPMDY